MERSGTLSEPSDNSTAPYIKKRPTLLGQPRYTLGLETAETERVVIPYAKSPRLCKSKYNFRIIKICAVFQISNIRLRVNNPYRVLHTRRFSHRASIGSEI